MNEAVIRAWWAHRQGLDGSLAGATAAEVLERTGWELDSVDAIELNEAFATQSIACIRELGLDEEKVNAWGGAIALGHPLGSSGSRITLTLLNRLETDGLSRGIATMCVGVGQGTAIAIERV